MKDPVLSQANHAKWPYFSTKPCPNAQMFDDGFLGRQSASASHPEVATVMIFAKDNK